MSERIWYGRVDTPFSECGKWRLQARLVGGWRFEVDAVRYNRPRLLCVGGGIHLGEPWGEEGALWSVNLRVYDFGLSIGFRGPEPELLEIDPDSDDDEEVSP